MKRRKSNTQVVKKNNEEGNYLLQICRITKNKPIKIYAGSKGHKKQWLYVIILFPKRIYFEVYNLESSWQS